MSHETTLIEELIQETQKQPQISSYIIPRGLTFFFSISFLLFYYNSFLYIPLYVLIN